jgi:hypothetical protein
VTRTCRRCGDRFETDRDWHRYCWDCYWKLRDGGRWTEPPPEWNEPPQSAPQLDVRSLRDAIQLCHPDRHPPERAKTANAVTATLLELLRVQRENGR